MVDTPNKHVYRVADIEVDLLRGSLRRNGESTFLREQTLQVFCYLMDHRAETVTKEDLIKNVWQGTAVTDDALVQCIVEIRKALGDDSRHPKFVKTVPKIGYRFIAPVEEQFNSVTTVHTEEVTSVQVEEEEEFTDEVETARKGFFSRKLVSSRPVFFALIVLLGGAIGLYFYQRSINSRRELSRLNLSPIPGKRPVVVMFFEDRTGATDLNWLREGLSDMLIGDLSRSSKLAVFSRQQLYMLLERIGHRPNDTIHLEKALDIAQKAQAQAVVIGNFSKVADKIRIEVQLHDAPGGQLVASENFVVDNPKEILVQIPLVSLKLRKYLGASVMETDEQTGLTEVMTKSLEAYRYYSQALEKAQGLQNTEAIALLEKAIALDPEFAMAHARIGYAYAVTWNLAEKARPHLEKAFKLSERLTEKDKLNISAWYAIANLDYEAAIKEYRRIITDFPLDIEAYQRLARLLQGEERFEEALEVTKQGLVIDPEAKQLYNLLGGINQSLGRHPEAIAAFERYVALAPGDPNALDSLGLGYQWIGRYEQAIREYNRALALKPEFEITVIHLANAHFQQGRYEDALTQFNRYIEIVQTAFERARGYDSIGYLLWKSGRLLEAQKAARRASYEKTYITSSFVLALERNRIAEAETLLNRLVKQSTYTHRGTRGPARAHYFLQGLLDLKRGRPSEALDAFRQALQYTPLIWHIDSYEDCLGLAYLELNQIDQAISEFERILRLNPNYPLAHYHLAEAYERKGQKEQARALYQRFLQVWKDADADLPQVVNARQRLSELN